MFSWSKPAMMSTSLWKSSLVFLEAPSFRTFTATLVGKLSDISTTPKREMMTTHEHCVKTGTTLDFTRSRPIGFHFLLLFVLS